MFGSTEAAAFHVYVSAFFFFLGKGDLKLSIYESNVTSITIY